MKSKKFLSLLLVLSVIISLCVGLGVSASAASISETVTPNYAWYTTSGAGTETNPYQIDTAAELLAFANLVNGTYTPSDIGETTATAKTFTGQYVTLTANITLATNGLYTSVAGVIYGSSSFPVKMDQYYLQASAPVWTPIGSGTATSNTDLSSYNAFDGTFDGAGHTVSGIYTGTTSATSGNTDTVQGLFGVVTGTVKNVTVDGCIIAKGVAAGIVAYLNGGTVQNCVNNAIVFADGGTTPGGDVENGVLRMGAVGGIVGNAMTGSSVTNCLNNGSIFCANSNKGGRTGGIIGLIDGTSYVVAVSQNKNTGSIDSYQYAGGIVGMNYSNVSPISACGNIGNVKAHSTGKAYAGGITAYSNSNILNCYNRGDFMIQIDGGGNVGTKTAHAGGIVSDLVNSTVTNCYNTGMFVGTVSGEDTLLASSYGMICGTGYGTSSNNKLINCYTVSVAGATWPGEDLTNGCVTAESTTYMQSEDFLEDLGSAFAYISGGNYPKLAWE